MKNKKADLSLSINAIVVLILAITMLGLGLAFMRNIFGSATSEFKEVSGTVKKQMIDQMKESDKVVELSRPKVELKQGESTQIFMGLKNEQNTPSIFFVQNVETTPLGAGFSNKYNITPGGIVNFSELNTRCGIARGTTHTTDVYLEMKTQNTTVKGNDIAVLPINIKTLSNAAIGTCLFELSVNTTATSSSNLNVAELTVDIIG
jgi:hypothetical protein